MLEFYLLYGDVKNSTNVINLTEKANFVKADPKNEM